MEARLPIQPAVGLGLARGELLVLAAERRWFFVVAVAAFVGGPATQAVDDGEQTAQGVRDWFARADFDSDAHWWRRDG